MTAKQRAFLAAFALVGNVTEAAARSKTGRRTHYDWLEQPEYRSAFEDAREQAADRLETELYKAATVGIEEPVIYQGQLCFEPLRGKDGRILRDKKKQIKFSKQPLSVRKFHPVAAFFLLKGMRPEKYRDNMHVSGSLNVNIADRLAAARARLRASMPPPELPPDAES